MPPATSKIRDDAHSAAQPFSSPEKRTVVLSLALILAVLALYNPASRHPFVNFDDDGYVTNNSHVRTGLGWDTMKWAFTTAELANWHPITWLSHALDYQLFGLNPAGHHDTNILLHAANVVILFLLLQWTTGFTWRSLMVAALFATASHQRGIGSLDLGAEEFAQHVVLSSRSVGLWMVCAKTQVWGDMRS